MELIKAMKIKRRMCKYYNGNCDECRPDRHDNYHKKICINFLEKYPEEAEKILEEFDRNHPAKTILQDFMDKFPKALLNRNGTPVGCPFRLGYEKYENCPCSDGKNYACEKCWNRTLDELKERDT